MQDMLCRWVRHILPVLAVCAAAGCDTSWRPPVSIRPQTRSIVVDHQTDGTHRRLLVKDSVWYQLTGSDLLVLDTTGRLISRQQLASSGTSAPGRDLIAVNDQLAVLLGDNEVVLLELSDPWRPKIVDRIDAATLGMWPTRLGSRGDEVVVLGRGSARTLSGGIVARSDGEEITSLVDHRQRLLHVAGRRIHRRAGDTYLGTASLLQVALPNRHLPDAALLFARNESSGSLVGFLGEDCRELDAAVMTVAIPGEVTRLRQRGGRVLVVSDAALTVLRPTGEGLQNEWSWPIEGLQDADWIDDEHMAVAGTFGCGIVSVGAHDPIETAVAWRPAPAGLTRAASDGSGLRADGAGGHWVYQIGQQATQEVPLETPLADPAREAAVLGWSAQINDKGVAELKAPDGSHTLEAPGGGRFYCVAATEDAFWFGHDRGILLLSLQASEDGHAAIESRRLGILIDGPVICIEPLVLGRGVAYAAEHGGFGVVREEY
tara:strand:+ start:1622 stop:3088 length:1467 start_codon:yes stop_codon:yes gene_type:complete